MRLTHTFFGVSLVGVDMVVLVVFHRDHISSSHLLLLIKTLQNVA